MKTLNLIAKPVTWVSHALVKWLHRKTRAKQTLLPFARRHWLRRVTHNPRTYHVIFGSILMLVAGHLYHSPPHILTSEFWEMSAFGIHGLGAAPIINLIGEAFGIDV
jgi:hypothetical protein